MKNQAANCWRWNFSNFSIFCEVGSIISRLYAKIGWMKVLIKYIDVIGSNPFWPLNGKQEKLEKFQRQLLKKILTLSINTPDSAIFIVTGFLPVIAQIERKALTIFNNIYVELTLNCKQHVLLLLYSDLLSHFRSFCTMFILGCLHVLIYLQPASRFHLIKYTTNFTEYRNIGKISTSNC
jgi:hypothetical protein